MLCCMPPLAAAARRRCPCCFSALRRCGHLPHCSDPSLSCCQVAEHVRRAAEELTAAADELPVCDCAVLDEEHMARVVHDLGKAERAVINVHSGLRLLEQKHEGGPVGLATLEVRHTPTCACSLHIVGACPPS